MPKDLMKELEQMRRILARFSLSEMRCIVLERFSSMSWEDVIEIIQEQREPLNSKTVAAVLVGILKKKVLKANVLDRTLAKITLTELSEHCNRRMWFSFDLHGNGHKRVLEREEISEAVTNYCMEDSILDVNVIVIRRESFYWLMVREKKLAPKKSKKRDESADNQYKAPLFFTAPFKEPFLFAPHKKINETILKGVVAALGYNSSKRLRFSDSNIVEMLKNLKLRDKQAAGQATLSDDTYVQGPPKRLKGGGFDFTGSDSRQKYVDDKFGQTPPIKKYIGFSAKEKLDLIDRSEDIMFPMRLTIKSNSVWDIVKTTLVKTEAIEFPPPRFLELALLTAKDEINLKSQQS